MADCSVTIVDFPSDMFESCNPDLNGEHPLTPDEGNFNTTVSCVTVQVQLDGNGKWQVHLFEGGVDYYSDPTMSGGPTPPADETVSFPDIPNATARIEYA